MYKVLLIGCLLLSSFNLWSEEKKSKILTVTIENILESNAKDFGTSTNESTISQDFYFDFDLTNEYILQAYTGGTKQIEGAATDSTWNDSYFQLEKTVFTGSIFKFLLSGRYIIPLSEKSRDVTGMNWGMQLRPTFILTFYKDGDQSFTYRSRPTWNEYFYSEDVDTTGYYNIERSFVWANRFKFQATAWLYLAAFFDFTTQWNSNGDHVNDSWRMTQLIGATINENIYVELTHSDGGKLYNQDGRRQSVDAFDSNSSTYAINLGFTF